MKGRLQHQRHKTAMLIKRPQRVMRESRNLLEQREVQLEQLEPILQSAADRGIRGWKRGRQDRSNRQRRSLGWKSSLRPYLRLYKPPARSSISKPVEYSTLFELTPKKVGKWVASGINRLTKA